MKITSYEPIGLTAPYLRPRAPAGHPSNGPRNCVWVRIRTDEGLTGWGEAYCGVYATEVTLASLKRLGRGLIGRDPRQPGELMAGLRYDNRYWAMRGIGAQAASAIEAALWDICAQSRGEPLWRVLGDGGLHPVMPYASAGDVRFSPREMFDEARRFVQEGYLAYKMRCGGSRLEAPPEHQLAIDVERVAAAREALGPDRLLFADLAVPQKAVTPSVEKSAAYFEALAPYAVTFIEEPAMTYDVAAYRYLNSLNAVHAAGGESFGCPEEFEPFLEARALGVAQPDAAVVGGPACCAVVCRRARECGVPVALHSWSAGVGIAQNLQAAWAVPGVLTMEWPQSIHALATDPIEGLFRFEDGYLVPEDHVGLGVGITDAFVTLYPLALNAERDY